MSGIFSKNLAYLYGSYKSIGKNVGIWIADQFKIKSIKKEKRALPNNETQSIPQLQKEFILKTMKYAQDVYEKENNFENVLVQEEESGLFHPAFCCFNDSNDTYVVIRGTYDMKYDAITDMTCLEYYKKINGEVIYFHVGFYAASVYVLSKIREIHIFENNKYGKIYFVGHSYGASVASILCLLTKSKYKEKEIYAMAYAPAPAMSFCPKSISDCIYVFINRFDTIPRCCIYNISKALEHYNITHILKILDIILSNIKYIKNIYEVIKSLIKFVEKHIFDPKTSKVRSVKGMIFAIGLQETDDLNKCLINEDDIGGNINLGVLDFTDHQIKNYIKTFEDNYT